MVARIRLEADVAEADLAAGETALIKIAVTNAGSIVDAFDITVRDLDPAWYTLSPARVSLFPQAQSSVILRLHPTGGANALAGAYPFQLVATSRDTPDDSTDIPMQLRIAAVGDLLLDIEPKRIVARQGTYTVALTNTGNTARDVVVRPSDPEARLAFTFGAAKAIPYEPPDVVPPVGSTVPATSPDAPTMQYDVSGDRMGSRAALLPSSLDTDWTRPGGDAAQGYLSFTMPPASRIDLPLNVQTKGRIWTGNGAVQLPFEVTATPPGVEWEPNEARKTSGELVYKPILSWWSGLPIVLRRVLAIGIPLLLLLGIGAALLRQPTGSQAQPTLAGINVGATQTAAANAQLTALANAAASQTALAQAAANAAAGNNATQTALAQQNAAATQTALAQAAANNGTGGPGSSGTAGSGSASAVSTFSGPPAINKFDFVSASDGTLRVEWTVANAITTTLNNVTVPLTGTQVVDTATDQSFTLTATNGRDTVTQSRGVMLMRPPQIQTFSADQSEVCSGCEVTLTWKALRAEKLNLDGQPLDSSNGTMKFKPTARKEYVLTVENVLGKDIRTVAVNVNPNSTPTAQP